MPASAAPDGAPKLAFLGMGIMGLAMVRQLLSLQFNGVMMRDAQSHNAGLDHLLYVHASLQLRVQARRLLAAGYKVTVWNRSADKCDPLAAEGATVASSVKEAVAAADITMAMLSDPSAALAVAEEAAAGLAKGAVLALLYI